MATARKATVKKPTADKAAEGVKAAEKTRKAPVRRTPQEKVIADFEQAKKAFERAQRRFDKAEAEYQTAAQVLDGAAYSYDYYGQHPLLPEDMRPEPVADDEDTPDADEDTPDEG